MSAGACGCLPSIGRTRTRSSRVDYDKTLTELIGKSPDEADSAVLMYHGLVHRPEKATVY